MSQIKKTWRTSPCDQMEVQALCGTLSLPPLIAEIVSRGNLCTENDCNAFLDPRLTDMAEPDLMKGAGEAAIILADALKHSLPVFIYGDYDVDGITSSAVLASFFKEVGYNFEVYQPNRFDHGYGLHSELIEDIVSRAPRGGVLITVDCGISNHDAVALAREGGLTVIITDHHQPPSRLPVADVIVNPLQKGCLFPEKYLAGVGVAFYVLIALRKELRQRGELSIEPNLKNLLDLVAIGTICDMVPLQGTNRVFASIGLGVLRQSRRPGLMALKESSGVSPDQYLYADDIGFRIGPRLNAAGRMASAKLAFDLLMTESSIEAKKLAAQLEFFNEERKSLTEQLVEEAITLSGRQPPAALVVGGIGWHQGILGIVASKLTEHFNCPVVVYGIDPKKPDIARASCRSVSGFNIHEALQQCADLLIGFGGHEQAAGLSILVEDIDGFTERLRSIAEQAAIKQEKFISVIEVTDPDAFMTESFLQFYKKIGPFGVSNPEPIFAARSCTFDNVAVLKEKHLRMQWKRPDNCLPCIAFNYSQWARMVAENSVDMAFALRPNFFRGVEKWQLHVIDLREAISD